MQKRLRGVDGEEGSSDDENSRPRGSKITTGVDDASTSLMEEGDEQSQQSGEVGGGSVRTARGKRRVEERSALELCLEHLQRTLERSGAVCSVNFHGSLG